MYVYPWYDEKYPGYDEKYPGYDEKYPGYDDSEGINIQGQRGYQYPGSTRVSISGVNEGINIRG